MLKHVAKDGEVVNCSEPGWVFKLRCNADVETFTALTTQWNFSTAKGECLRHSKPLRFIKSIKFHWWRRFRNRIRKRTLIHEMSHFYTVAAPMITFTDRLLVILNPYF